ncbi:MAG: hypothetical protein GYB68_09735 [Chloroflexi bacterium]|nr:hypothetical protein [Chloroflexota bacterium]
MAKPVVDRIEQTVAGDAQVIHLNALSEVGRVAAATYGVRALPTLVLLDGCGQPVARYAGFELVPQQIAEDVRKVNQCQPDLSSP